MLEGVITPIVTLFDRERHIDYKAEGKLIDFLISKGVNGILFMGSMGEFPYLTMDERKEFTEFAVEYVAKRVKVLIGTGAAVGHEAIEHMRFASKAGADYATVITPYYFNYGDQAYYNYYEVLANSADIPIIIYNYPGLTGYNLSPELFKNIISHIPGVIGIKDTVDAISHVRSIIQTAQCVNRPIYVFCGFDDYLLETLSLGGCGVIGGISNLIPDIVVGLYNEYKVGNLVGIEQNNRILARLTNIFDLWKPASMVVKEALLARGIISEDNIYARIPATRMPYDKLYDMKTIIRTVLQ